MTDLLGPALTSTTGAALDGVTTRPTDIRVIGSADTWFQDCSSATVDDGTEVSASWANSILAVLRTAMRGNGLRADGVTPVLADQNPSDSMLLLAMQIMMQRGLYSRAVDTGTLNNLVAVLSPVPPELPDGFTISIKALLTTTAASHITVAGTQYPIILRNGAATVGGEISATDWSLLTFNKTRAAFQIMGPWTVPPAASYPSTAFWYEGSASGGTANALTTVLNPVPAVAAATAAACTGLNIRMPVTLTDTAASTLTFGVTVNGTPVNIQLPIVLNSTGAALSGGEMTGGANYAADFSIDSLGNARLMNAIGHASIPNIQVIAASGNYVPTSGAKTAIVIATAGGASGGVACGGGGGGGAGETVIGIVPLTGVTSVPCTIGAGGAAVNGIQTIGNNGGNTTFGSYLTAVGGSGGRMPNIAYGLGGLGGSGGTGLFQIPGGDGESSFNSGNAQNGNGGGSYWGGGGVGNYDTQAGGNGRAPGAGGGGSNDWPGGNTSPQVSISGAGAPGVIFVMEF